MEAEWNNTLCALVAAQGDSDRQRTAQSAATTVDQRQPVMALVTDFPRLWRDPATPQRERKRMVRILLRTSH